MRTTSWLAILATISGASLVEYAAIAETETFTVIRGGQNVGHLVADVAGASTRIDFDYKNNGRGPTIAETIVLDELGRPRSWQITGSTTFGSKVDERFEWAGNSARWTDPVGPAEATISEPKIYVAEGASPWALGLYARALLADSDQTMEALPSGTLTLERGEALAIAGASANVAVTAYTLSGIDLNPSYMLLDEGGGLFAWMTPEFVVVRQGFEGEEQRLRGLAAAMSTSRYVAIEKAAAHRYEAPLRIRNVRVFEPAVGRLSAQVSVVVNGNRIAAVDSADAPATPGEVVFDGGGGTLVPGLFDMHAHLDQDSALLNVIAGVTSVRDMGNDNAVLDGLIARIASGTIGGPRVTRSGFIEGKSPFNANNGIVVASEAEAVDAVRWYGARGYWQVKVYNSMNPAWVPAVAREAHRLGMRVAGHVPAFSRADAMIAAGYDELTHINQVMLGWVLAPEEDTRTLLRLTALRRLPRLDLDSPVVRTTLDAMVARNVAIDPTLAIHEALTENRDGQVPPGAVDYLEHMPVGFQRSAKKAMTDASAPDDDRAYRESLEKILEAVKLMHERGVLLLMGTDLGGSFTLHRELELYQRVGMTAPEILRRATLDAARYLGQGEQLGSIEKGKLADFFLVPGDPTADLKAIKTIRMVVKDGIVYFPSEVYPHFGVSPFVDAPARLAGPAR